MGGPQEGGYNASLVFCNFLILINRVREFLRGELELVGVV